MKVLIVTDGLLPPVVYSSGHIIIYELIKNLKKQGVDVHILTCYDNWTLKNWRTWIATETKLNGIPIHVLYLKIWDKYPRFCFFISRWIYFFKAWKLHSKYNYDIIHDYSSSPLLIWRTCFYRLFLNVKSIHTISTVNFSIFGSMKLSTSPRFLNAIICTNKYMEKQWLRYTEYKNRIYYLPLGVDFQKFSKIKYSREILLNKLEIKCSTPVVLYVGPFEVRKGFFLLLNAMKIVLKQCPNAIFLFVSPKSRDSLHESFNINQNMILKDFKEYANSIRIIEGIVDIPSYMNIADVFVLPQISAHGTLGQPLILLEAMVCGKKIIASDTIGVTDLLIHKYNGLLFHTGNVSELANSIISLILARDNDVLGRNAKEDIKSYDVKLISKKIKKLYEEILSK